MKTHAGAAAEPSDAQIMALWRECSIPTDENDHTTGPLPFARAVLALTSAPAEPPKGMALVPKHFLADVHTAAGLIEHGRQCKALSKRLSEGVMTAYAAAPAQTPQAAGAIDAREQEAIETPFGTYPKDAWDAFEKHRIDQTLILGMPGLKSRPSFMAGWNAAITSRKEAPATTEPDWNNRRTDSLAGWINELATLADHHASMPGFVRSAMKIITQGLVEHSAPPAAGAAQATNATLVYGALSDKARQRTSRENVEDVLEALAATPAPEPGSVAIPIDLVRRATRVLACASTALIADGDKTFLDLSAFYEKAKAAHPGERKP